MGDIRSPVLRNHVARYQPILPAMICNGAGRARPKYWEVSCVVSSSDINVMYDVNVLLVLL